LWVWQYPARALRALRVSRAALDPHHQAMGNGEGSKAALGKEAGRAGDKPDRSGCTINGYTSRDRLGFTLGRTQTRKFV